MKKKGIPILILIAPTLLLLSISTAISEKSAENRVWVGLSHITSYVTDQDFVRNIPLEWKTMWGVDINNKGDDTHEPVINPQVVMKSALKLRSFYPDYPKIFSAQQILGLYTWDFSGYNISEFEELHLHASENGNAIKEKPKFTISRTVTPEILADKTTLQKVTIFFRLEEPLPPEISHFKVTVKMLQSIFEESSLAEFEVVSYKETEDWNSDCLSSEVSWVRNVAPEVGKPYIFEVTIKSAKSDEILGSPIFKPWVGVFYNSGQTQESKTSESVILVYSDVVSATVSADNVVTWDPYVSSIAYGLVLDQVLLGIVGDEPPFHVKVNASVTVSEILDLASEAMFLALVELPKGYDVNDIDVSTLTCEGSPAVKGVVLDDRTYKAEFNIQNLAVPVGEAVILKITGELTDGTLFEGFCTVRIINSQPAKEKINNLESLINECSGYDLDVESEESSLSEAKDYLTNKEYGEALSICIKAITSLEEKKKKFLETKILTDKLIEDAEKEIENSKGFLINTSEAEVEIAKARSEFENFNFDKAQHHAQRALDEVARQKKLRICIFFTSILAGVFVILLIIIRMKKAEEKM